MSASWAGSAPRFRPLGPADLAAVRTLPLHDPVTVAFLDPVDTILEAVRAGPAHQLIGIEDAEGLAGFFVVHPDTRDLSCWWLGWLAISPGRQGCGLGRHAMMELAGRLGRVDGCRRIRLVVSPANLAARRLYARAGFVRIGQDAEGWHLLEWSLPPRRPGGRLHTRRAVAPGRPVRRMDRRGRKKPVAGSVAVRASGPLHAPPAIDCSLHHS